MKEGKFDGLWKHYLLMLIVFFVSAFAGYYTSLNNPSAAVTQVETLSREFAFVKKLSPLLIFLLIFANNSIKALISTVAGTFAGIFPVCFVAINGYIVGVVYCVKGQQIGYTTALLYLIPHGVIEIPAILLACSYGTWLGMRFLKKVRGEKVNFGEDFKMAIKACLKNVVPLLFVAALIETFITPLVVELLKSIF